MFHSWDYLVLYDGNYSFFFILFSKMSVCQREWERELDLKDPQCTVSLLKCLHGRGLGQCETRPEAGSREENPGLPCVWHESNQLNYQFCLQGYSLTVSWSQKIELGIEVKYFEMGVGVTPGVLTSKVYAYL